MGLKHPVTQVTQDLDRVGSDIVVVFDYQDRFSALAFGRRQFFGGLFSDCIAGQAREINLYRSALSGLGIDFYMPTGLFDEAVHLTEA